MNFGGGSLDWKSEVLLRFLIVESKWRAGNPPKIQITFQQNTFQICSLFCLISEKLLKFLGINVYMYIKPTIHDHLFLLSVKCKLCSGLEKGWGLSVLFMLIVARFEFDLVIYCNFCSFWVLFIYWWLVLVVLRLEDFFFISSHLWLNGALFIFFEKLVLWNYFF